MQVHTYDSGITPVMITIKSIMHVHQRVIQIIIQLSPTSDVALSGVPNMSSKAVKWLEMQKFAIQHRQSSLRWEFAQHLQRVRFENLARGRMTPWHLSCSIENKDNLKDAIALHPSDLTCFLHNNDSVDQVSPVNLKLISIFWQASIHSALALLHHLCIDDFRRLHRNTGT